MARSEKLLQGKFEKLDANTYALQYENDYALDKVLIRGVKNIAELAVLLQKHFHTQKGELKMKGGGFACTTFNAFTKDGQHSLNIHC